MINLMARGYIDWAMALPMKGNSCMDPNLEKVNSLSVTVRFTLAIS